MGALHEELFSAVDVGLAVWAPTSGQLVVAQANPAARALLGQPLQEGEAADRVLDDHRVLLALIETLADERGHTVDGILVADRVLQVRTHLLGAGCVAMVVIDVTAHHEDRRRLGHATRHDALTGLGNRRALEEALAHEAARAARTDEPVGVLLVDVDRFKSINDVHGHGAGDACLRAVAEALLGAVRAADSCFRWGGDEFVVLLPATDLVATREAAARAAASVAGRRAPDGTPMSASIGCAELRGDLTVDEVFAAADADLLAAKAARRAASA